MNDKKRTFCRWVNFLTPMMAAEFSGYTLEDVQDQRLADFLKTDEAKKMIAQEKEAADQEAAETFKRMTQRLEQAEKVCGGGNVTP